jgi:16S rRNA (cytidine1402-2'-O)-methyltransferase
MSGQPLWEWQAVARDHKKSGKNPSAASPLAPTSRPESLSVDPKALEGAGKSYPVAEGEGQNMTDAQGSALSPGLYITATPIGNASDITLRALNVLRSCDAIVAEDTRVTARLLAIHGISRPLLIYNDHNAPTVRPKLLQRLREGARLALVSDAGTPLISDPGHKLVTAAYEQGIAVYPIPGPSAALAALTVSGLPSERFLFAGFLPAKSGERRSALMELSVIPATLVVFESPQRLAGTLADMAEILGAREGAVTRELTKLHEEVRRAPLAELAEFYANAGVPKGEITLVVGPPAAKIEANPARIDELLAQVLPFMPVRAASTLIADLTGVSKRAVYNRAIALKGAMDKDNVGGASHT